MKISTFLIVLILALPLSSVAQFKNPLKKVTSFIKTSSLSEDEVVSGLKAALEKGIELASNEVSRENGYFQNPQIKIPWPEDARNAEAQLRQIGLGSEVDKLILSINRAAELAAKESKEVFVVAIKAMTVEDAWGILKGEDDAATQYLNKTSSAELNARFKPIVHSALEQVNATKYYEDLVLTYNKIPFVKKLNPDLDQYATQMAINGLFTMVAKEEKKIREDPLARTNEILQKVFGQN